MIRFLPLFLAAWLFADGHILLYHRVGEAKPSGISMNITVDKLRQDLKYLKDNGYKVVPLSEMVAKVKAKQPIDDKMVAITFDDAYKSTYTNGAPILKEFGYPYALMVYVQAVSSGWPDYMTWQEVENLKKNGVEIGLHSYGHIDMSEAKIEIVKEDTTKSFDVFKQKMNFSPKYYAYPFGAYNINVQCEIEKITGVEAILTTDSGAVTSYSNPLALPRSALNTQSNLKAILKMHTMNLKVTENTDKSGQTKISGEIIDLNISKISVYIAPGNRKTVPVKDGKFEFTIDKAHMNKKRKLIFYDGIYTVAKTISKE